MRDCIRLIYGEVPRVAHLEFLIRMVLAVPEKDIMSCNGSLNGRGIGEAKASAAGPPPEYATAGCLYGIHDQHRHEFVRIRGLTLLHGCRTNGILAYFASQYFDL